MITNLKNCPEVKKWMKYSFLTILLFTPVLQIFLSTSSINTVSSDEISNNMNVYWDLDEDSIRDTSINLKMEELAQNTNPEAYFPNFLFTSIEIANLMIENLYNNISGGFYTSINEGWQYLSINPELRTYDNAQAILALLKLSNAVINDTEREFALSVAKKTGDALITDLWDPDFDGFFLSEGDRYKKPGVQGKAIQAFLSLYEETNISTYLDVATDAFDFINDYAWNNTYGYYDYVISHTGSPLSENPNPEDPYEPQSLRVDHNVLMGNALLDLYRVDNNELYLSKARQIYNIINTTCRNISNNLFYTGIDITHEIVIPETADLFINSLVLEFLANLYNVTEDSKYYDDFFPLLNSVMINFWDNRYGGFIGSTFFPNRDLDDPIKYTERQFYGIRALDEAFKLTDNNLYYNLILDTVEFLSNNLYDQFNGGYYQLANGDGSQSEDPSWRGKLTVTQSLAIYSLASIWMYSRPGALNVIWSPTTPRPQDEVRFVIAAFDANGIASVFLNYSIDKGTYELQEMLPHSIGNMFNTSLSSPHFDGTTIDFNIIITNDLDVKAVRGDYSFFWQTDKWGPEIEELGFIPGLDIPVNEEFTIMVSAHDVPSQGDVSYVRVHYHRSGEDSKSLSLERIDNHIWSVTFPNGLPVPGSYAYYFEAADLNLIPSFGHVSFFRILGIEVPPTPLPSVIGLLFVIGVVVPGGLYAFVEYKKKGARKILKSRKQVRDMSRGRKLSKRGRKRT